MGWIRWQWQNENDDGNGDGNGYDDNDTSGYITVESDAGEGMDECAYKIFSSQTAMETQSNVIVQ